MDGDILSKIPPSSLFISGDGLESPVGCDCGLGGGDWGPVAAVGGGECVGPDGVAVAVNPLGRGSRRSGAALRCPLGVDGRLAEMNRGGSNPHELLCLVIQLVIFSLRFTRRG